MNGAETAVANPAAYLLQAVLSLLFVIALIYGAYFALRRVSRVAAAPAEAGPAQILQTLPLHGGGVLHVVRLGQKVHLIASGPQGVTALASDELPETEIHET